MTQTAGEQGVLEGVPSERRTADLIRDLAPMSTAGDLAGLWAGLARAVVRAVRADACLVSVLDDRRTTLRDMAASVVPPARLNVVAEEHAVDDYPTTQKVIDTGDPVQIGRGETGADRAEVGFLERLGFGRVMICPLTTDEGVIGTIEAYRLADQPFRRDDPREIEVLNAYAASVYSRIQLASRLERHYLITIEALTSALEARDPYTQAHTSRIRDLALGLAVAMQVPDEILHAVKLGALLHDVGKIGVSDTILLKQGPLSDKEWDLMRAHPIIGERMLNGIDFLQPALPVVRHHHERFDGRGYPDRLAEADIPLAARIVAVCDAYDAMTSDRPYRKALTPQQACGELMKVAGAQHDPMCTGLLVDIVSRLGEHDIEERFVRFSA